MIWLVKNYFSRLHFLSLQHITITLMMADMISKGISPSSIAVSIRSLPKTYINNADIASPHKSFII